jgi:AbrB family looped-hinge helix DNA binding protein
MTLVVISVRYRMAWHMTRVRAKVAKGGRIVIPAEFRRALGLDVGDEVILDLDPGEGQVTMLTPRQAIKRAQEAVRRYVPEGHRLVEGLIAERRAEAAGE